LCAAKPYFALIVKPKSIFMDQAMLNLVNGIPIAAAVLYIWRISDRNHMEEIAKWRESYEKKDAELSEMKAAIATLSAEIQKFTLIMSNYVIRNRKNTAGKQGQRTEKRPGA
jgi:hypothetical protein